HGISGSEIGEHRATARHPGNTAIVHSFAGRDVPGSAWEEPERDEHQLVQGAAHPRYAIRTRPAFIRTRGGCSYPDSAPVGAPPSVRTGASTFSHPGRVLLQRSPHPLHSAGDDAADATHHQPANMGGVGDS